jgi:hypothetical protein
LGPESPGRRVAWRGSPRPGEPKTAATTTRSRCPSDPEVPCQSQPPGTDGPSGRLVAPGTYFARVAAVTSVHGGGSLAYP